VCQMRRIENRVWIKQAHAFHLFPKNSKVFLDVCGLEDDQKHVKTISNERGK
jgi:hypothetical protein